MAAPARDWQTRHRARSARGCSAPTPPPRRLTTEALGHRFTRLRDAADVPGATLHRLRHNVATFLVARGEILQAQARLGHADAATTLREYAYALPLTDGYSPTPSIDTSTTSSSTATSPGTSLTSRSVDASQSVVQVLGGWGGTVGPRSTRRFVGHR